MSDTRHIRFAQMQMLSSSLATAQQNIASSLETLENEVDTLKGRWSGEAALAYTTAQASWTASLEAMRALLASATKTTDGVIERHSAAQQEVRGIWG